MNNSVFRSKRFLFGIGYFIVLLAASFFIGQHHDLFFSEHETLIMDEKGKIVKETPFDPWTAPPFGTDRQGNSMFFKLLDGARFTILIVFSICAIQMVLGILIGGATAYAPSFIRKGIEQICQAYLYIPTILWSIVLMMPLMVQSGQEGYRFSLILYQCAVLVCVSLPPLILAIGKEMQWMNKQEYVISSRLLGAGTLHVFRKHAWPYLRETIIVLFLQQVVQTLILLIHLGFFEIIIGGRMIKTDILTGEASVHPFVNEWSSIIGLSRDELIHAPWIALSPLVTYMVTIFVTNAMIEGMKGSGKWRMYSVLNNK
jgi:peptide/nickel transport system permease protein